MASTIRVRATSSGETTEVQALIQHPMDSGFVKDAKGELIPPHFIQQLTFEHDGKNVFVADWGGAVSKDPYVKFAFKGGKKGDDLKISWVDNKGATDTTTAKIQRSCSAGAEEPDEAADRFLLWHCAGRAARRRRCTGCRHAQPAGRCRRVQEVFHRQISKGEAGG